MPLVPDHSASLRQNGGAPPTIPISDDDIHVEILDDTLDSVKTNSNGQITEIEHPDGSVTIALSEGALDEKKEKREVDWFGNLADGEIDQGELARISTELIDGIEQDKRSRNEWVEDRATGIKLLGLKIELPAAEGGTEGASMTGISKVRHPLLLEAVLRFQANARSELLPTDGPVKIRNDDNNVTLQEDELANALEQDMNHYLTKTASEYYADTDRMLLMLGFGGMTFKKVYFCPLRNRPVSETVDANDLIVSNQASDLGNARRITHRSMQKPSTVKRMQIIGEWRDISLSQALPKNKNALDREKEEQEGTSESSIRGEDRDREIYECYCELDLKGFEHKHDNKASGLEIPYIVTIDVTTKEILSVVRNYDEDTKELPVARQRFIDYTFIPGFGFYALGLLHILGNTTNAITAAWREMLDAGMFSSFPGFLLSDAGGRQNTNIFRIPPGGGALVKTGGMKISDAAMALPYKEPGQALMNLVTDMAQTGQRVGGTAEISVGEGKQDMPVGTTLALIEQAQKILSSVHKRLHASQAREFQLLKEVFAEHPESFWKSNKKPARPWDQETFRRALDNYNLVPQADPNTASHMQRIMKVMGLKQLQAANPELYDPIAVDTAALSALGWDNPQQFLSKKDPNAQPSPAAAEKMAKTKATEVTAQARLMDAQTNAEKVKIENAAKMHEMSAGGEVGPDGQFGPTLDELALKSRELDLREKRIVLDTAKAEDDSQHREEDRTAKVATDHDKIIQGDRHHEEAHAQGQHEHSEGQRSEAVKVLAGIAQTMANNASKEKK